MKALAVGVIGGLGPAATVDFLDRLVTATPAEIDDDHLRIHVDICPQIPNRNAAMRGEGPSPGPILARVARGLERAGAEVLVMPCNTAHHWRTDIEAAVSIPFIDMIAATAIEVSSVAKRAGILAGIGCHQADLYPAALWDAGVEPIVPTDDEKAEFMRILAVIKAGRFDGASEGMARLARRLIEHGAQTIVAACTEVPLVLCAHQLTVPMVSSTDALVAATLRTALHQT